MPFLSLLAQGGGFTGLRKKYWQLLWLLKTPSKTGDPRPKCLLWAPQKLFNVSEARSNSFLGARTKVE